MPNQRPKLIVSLCAQNMKSWVRANRGKKSSADQGFGVCHGALWASEVVVRRAALTLSSPIDGQMSPRPLMASVIRSAQRHQHKSMLLRRCSINNKITRAARFLARRRRYAAHGKWRAVQKKNPVRPLRSQSQPAPTASAEASPVFDAPPLLVKWPKIERRALQILFVS